MSDHIQSKPSPAERITANIVELLERGVRPWRARWNGSVTDAPASPLRANGEPYRGVNVVALWAAAYKNGFTSPYWLTFKQAFELGGVVPRGERGSFVVFYKPPAAASEEIASAEEAPRGRRVLRGYTVFNRAQIEGIEGRFDEPVPEAVVDITDLAERFGRVSADLRHGGPSAFYDVATDHVQMPPKSAFVEMTLYYATLAHELGHWTRHPSRLDRDFGQKRFGDAGYALEELVAELCSAFVGAKIGLPADHLEDHATFIAGWLKVLKNNPPAFLTAAGKAQAAADYLLRQMGEEIASVAPDD